MKILVTGANGYIGSKLVTKLLNMGNIVVATDLLNDHIDDRAIFIKCDIFSNNDFFEIFGKPDVCVHLAWRDGFVHNSLNHIYDLSNHFNFIKQMIDSGLKHIAIMGTMHEIGYHEGAVDENTPCNPKSFYGIAKNALREMVEVYSSGKQCIIQWLRGYYMYGNDLFGNSIFAKIRKAAIEGQETFPFTTGKNKFDFISVEDLCEQISYAVTQISVKGIINICSGEPVSLGEQMEWYIKKNNLNIKLEYGKFKERITESPCIYGDNTKIKQIITNKKIKILVTGVNGQLGHDCMIELKSRGYSNIKGIDITELDVTNRDSVIDYIEKYKPNVVMHNAAWTAVDKAEQMLEKVYEVNALGSKYIAEACKKVGAKIVYISTDYVFKGNGDKPFEINDSRDGLSVYGRTKSQGEDFIMQQTNKYFIVRTSWVFGKNGNNFVKTMLKLADMGKTELNVVCDQVGSVTYTYDLSKLLCDMIETEKYGIYHATNEGFISWAEFAEEIFKLSNKSVKINYVTTEEYKRLVPNQADRPLNSRMSKKSLDEAGFARLPDWKDALERYLKEIM